MTIQNSNTLKSYFNLGKVPTPSNYNDLVDTIFAQSTTGELGEHTHDDRYVQLSIANTISAVHTFTPSTYGPPFILGPNAQGQRITGLNADQLDNLHASANPGATAAILATTLTGSVQIEQMSIGIAPSGTYRVTVGGANALLVNTGNVIFNNAGDASSDFIIRGDNTTNLFVVDASVDAIGIGISTPTAKKLQMAHTFNDASGYPAMFSAGTTVTLPSGSTAWPYTTSQSMTVYPAYTVGNVTNFGYSTGVRDGPGNLSSVNGCVITVNMGGAYSGTIDQMYGLRFINSGVTEGTVTGTITNLRLISLDTVYKNSGNILGLAGIYIGPMTAGSVYSYAIQTTTGIVSFGDDLQFSAAKSIKTSSSYNLTLAPGGDLIINPTGKDVLPYAAYDINLGGVDKKYLSLHAAELWVETLVAINTMATIGGRVLIGATTELTQDLPAVNTTIYVKHNEMANGDIIYLEENGSVEFMQVTSAPSGSGPYSYSVTRNLDGTGANNWYAGTAVFNTGTTGDGFIDLYSFRGVKSASQYGPTIVGNVRNSSTYNAWTEHWAIGNLNGLYGYGVTTYGVGLGKYGANHIVIDPTDGIRFRDANNVVRFQVNSDYLYLGSQAARWLYVTPTSLQFKDTTAVWMSLSAASLVLGYDGGGSSVISIDTSNGVQIKDAAGTVRTSLTNAGSMWMGASVTTERLSFDTTNGLQIFNHANSAVLQFPTTGGGNIVGVLTVSGGSIVAGEGNVKLDTNGFSIMNYGSALTMYADGTSIAAQIYHNPVSNNQSTDWGAAMVLAAGDYGGGELAVNGSFESNSDWTYGGSSTPVRDTSNSRIGVYSVSGTIYADIMSGDTGTIATSNYITGIVAGNRIQISLWLWYQSQNNLSQKMHPDGVSRRVLVDWYNSSSVLISTYTYTLGYPPQDSWQRIAFVTTAAPANTSKIKVTFYQEAFGGSWYYQDLVNQYSVDDISIRITGQAASISVQRKGILFDIDASYSVLDVELQSYLFTGTGVEIGNVTQAPAIGELFMTGDIRTAGGVYVGTTASNPATGDIIATADGRLGGGLYVGSTSTDPATGVIITTGSIYINELSNTKVTLGLTINQGTATDESISLKNSDVAHGITDTTETDTYGFFGPVSADGGMRIRGISEVTDALNLYGLQTTGVTTKSNNAGAAITLTGGKKSGTAPTGLGADENIVRITSHGGVKFIFDADGDMWYTGNLQPYRNSTTYTGYIFVPLTTPFTSTNWDGNDTKNTGTYAIDLSTEFSSTLVGVKAVLVRISGHFATPEYSAVLRPRGSSVVTARMLGQVANIDNDVTVVVPTDSTDFDIDVVIAGGSMTQALLEIWGYWI